MGTFKLLDNEKNIYYLLNTSNGIIIMGYINTSKKIKISPEQKFKLWLNDTIKHIKGKYTISSDSTLLTITDSFSYIVRKGKIAYSTNKKNSEAIQYMLKDVHEPPYINYRVIANRYNEFTPSEIDQLKYEAYTEFPLIKVLAKNVVINYNENRANIKSAYIINKQTKDTTLVEFSYKGNKIIKDIIKNFHYSR